jgi:hypothetical protein
LVVKAQIIPNAMVNFGNVGDATKLFAGKKVLLMIWLIYVMTAGSIFEFWIMNILHLQNNGGIFMKVIFGTGYEYETI